MDETSETIVFVLLALGVLYYYVNGGTALGTLATVVSPSGSVAQAPAPIASVAIGAPVGAVSSTFVGQLDAATCVPVQLPPDWASWPVTTNITSVTFVPDPGGKLQIACSPPKIDGDVNDPNTWPDIVPPGWGGPLQYSIGLALNIGGQWYASAPVECWRGEGGGGGDITGSNPVAQVAANWFYDGRWGAMQGYQPRVGEVVGVFIVAGDARGNNYAVYERSDIVLLTVPATSGVTIGS